MTSLMRNADDWLIERSHSVNSLWAKSGTEDCYLRLPQHLIDAACAAEWLWDNWVAGSLKASLAMSWGLRKSQIKQLYCFLAGIHDVGKATLSFQRQLQDKTEKSYLLAEVKSAGLPLEWAPGEEGQKFPHGTASALILQQWLHEWGMSKMRAGRLASVVDAHHGFTSDPSLLREHASTIRNYPSEWSALHSELLNSMAKLTDIETVLDKLGCADGPYPDALQPMTGLVIMADWLASNEHAFPYAKSCSQHERVSVAMESISLPKPWKPIPPPADPAELFRQTFDWPDHYAVRPIQDVAAKIARAQDGQCLMIIEAPTGEGKTEAGLAAAHIIGERTGAQGVFFAAPTMSTANGLFDRTTEWVRHSSQGGEVVSMYLAHSKNQLSKDFQKLKFAGIGEDSLKYGSVVATQWLRDRRKGILSDFVVGTVDQVLMMALQARFSMLRHVGLAGKVIIIDEVHAYDAYMSQYLYRALEWLARYGASVILMSATLPPKQRRKLAAAYASQLLEKPELDLLDSEAYPLIATVSPRGVEVSEIPAGATDLTASVCMLGDDLSELSQSLRNLLDDGGIALVICNTVSRAQETFDALRDCFPDDIELHHAAFLASERSAKEDELRKKLGPRAHRGDSRPWRRVVVATQVAEQSLDIDADVLVTDIAPIDLLIQRVGRLHRHLRPLSDRPEKLREPKIFIRAVSLQGGIPEFDGGAAAIYGKKILLATVAHLPEVFRRPGDVAPLVRKVYSDDPAIPDTWNAMWYEACTEDVSKCSSAERRADTFRMPSSSSASELLELFSSLHSESANKASDDERGYAQVRDAELTVEVIAIQKSEYGYGPVGNDDIVQTGYDPTYRQALLLAGNTVRLPARMTRRESDFNAVVSDLEGQTPGEWAASGLLQGQVALVFDHEFKAQVGRFKLRYTSDRGLEILESD